MLSLNADKMNFLFVSPRTEFAAGTCDVQRTRTARKSATKWTTLGIVRAWIADTVVVICIYIVHTRFKTQVSSHHKSTW